MQSKLNPYINFKANAREAMEFYKSIFGGKLDMTTFKEANIPGMSDPSQDNNIMHAQLEAENGIIFMASDTPSEMPYESGKNINMSLSGDNEEELRGYWGKLSEGGTITMPLDKAPWGDTFGMLTDKFGISWMVNITATQQ
jgi:PhnB protein